MILSIIFTNTLSLMLGNKFFKLLLVLVDQKNGCQYAQNILEEYQYHLLLRYTRVEEVKWLKNI